MLTTSEWDKLQRLETLLEPCRYVMLPALCHLYRTMEVADEDPAYVERFKTAFKKNLSEQRANKNNEWLKMASAFKHLKYLRRGERDEVWTSLEALLQEEPSRATPGPSAEPAKKKRSLLLLAPDSDSVDEKGPNRALSLYKAEPSINMEECGGQLMQGPIYSCLPWLANMLLDPFLTCRQRSSKEEGSLEL